MLKKCNKCKQLKDTKEFWKNSKAADKLQFNCKPCQNKEKKLNYHKSDRAYQLKRYGITPIEFKKILVQQNNRCAICRTSKNEHDKNFVVDHDHKTGKVRGLLCDRCNRCLGSFNDSIKLLNKAINYLKNN